MARLFIIGNGFDCYAHFDDTQAGMKTRYVDFKNDILNSECIIEKIENQSDSNLYFDDGSYVMDTRKYNEVIEFPNGLNENGSYILICAGGV